MTKIGRCSPIARGAATGSTPLKFISFGAAGWYVTFGGEIREKFELLDQPGFGTGPLDQTGYASYGRDPRESRAHCRAIRVIVPSLVKELAGTIGTIAPRERWDLVDDVPEHRFRASRLVEHFL
jgi:hypothetical protein